ncbi:ASB12 [Branchiostoma lanceolatum]|uniref:ASB12 protein n=1 Tax=Branchiostoma lanceolatum TaxID=7740 RepID=A0A8J9YSX7_BRALA|nr:ASB12 [Branchiostoma lanceolatum]
MEAVQKQRLSAVLRQLVPLREGKDNQLHTAAETGDLDGLRQLVESDMNGQIDSKNHLGCTPLRLAAAKGHVDCVQYLVSHGAGLEVADIKSQTPLYAAVRRKHPDCAEVLLKAGAVPNGDPNNLATPLFRAAQDGCLPCMKVLIRYGAELNFSKPTMEKGALCSTVLYICLIYKHYECCKLLLCSGADPDFHVRKKLNLTNLAKDESLLQAVVKHDLPVEFAQLLIEFGINRFQRNSIGRTADQDSGNESAKFIRLSLDLRSTSTCNVSRWNRWNVQVESPEVSSRLARTATRLGPVNMADKFARYNESRDFEVLSNTPKLG